MGNILIKSGLQKTIFMSCLRGKKEYCTHGVQLLSNTDFSFPVRDTKRYYYKDGVS